jgi:signal transduction histidine kinase
MKTQALRRSITLPVVLFTIVLATVVTLTILWHVILVKDYNQMRELALKAQEQTGAQPFHWGVLAIGSVLFVTVVVLLSILASQLFSEIRWNERQQNFIASVSHELNSPLSSIKLYAQTLRSETLTPAERDRFLHVILSDVDRLAHLIRNILRAAQLDALPVRPELVPLAPYLEAYQAEVQLQLSRMNRGDEIVVAKIDPELHALLDRTLFRQVLDNLVDNATKYARGSHARIELSAEEHEGSCVILVKDDGLGIPKSELKKIFDRFYRIEGDSLRSRKGTGLGLYIVRSIVEGHDGTIEALSEGPQKGATFRIEIPIVPQTAHDGELAPPKELAA